MTVTNQTIHEQIILRNVCCHSVQNLLSSCILSKNLKIKIYKTRNLVGLCGYKIVPVTVIEVHRLKIFEKRATSNMYRPRKVKWQKEEYYIMLNFIICIVCPNLIQSRRLG
jgi:hypothetical protein